MDELSGESSSSDEFGDCEDSDMSSSQIPSVTTKTSYITDQFDKKQKNTQKRPLIVDITESPAQSLKNKRLEK
jgi:hypothetical protein